VEATIEFDLDGRLFIVMTYRDCKRFSRFFSVLTINRTILLVAKAKLKNILNTDLLINCDFPYLMQNGLYVFNCSYIFMYTLYAHTIL